MQDANQKEAEAFCLDTAYSTTKLCQWWSVLKRLCKVITHFGAAGRLQRPAPSSIICRAEPLCTRAETLRRKSMAEELWEMKEVDRLKQLLHAHPHWLIWSCTEESRWQQALVCEGLSLKTRDWLQGSGTFGLPVRCGWYCQPDFGLFPKIVISLLDELN